jgi:hypothetical protein
VPETKLMLMLQTNSHSAVSSSEDGSVVEDGSSAALPVAGGAPGEQHSHHLGVAADVGD